MQFHVLTIFPKMLESYFSESLFGKAIEKGFLEICFHDLRNYAQNKHQSVDERPYGGGPGMLMRPEVVVSAVEDLISRFGKMEVYVMSPRGKVFDQASARALSKQEKILLICGRYEGIDERALEVLNATEISIGDYVLTGGELAAGVVIDAVGRLIPGVVGDGESLESESHSNSKLEYPQYTRPPEFRGKKVPEVLLSGDHAAIEKWREAASLELTQKRRPDLIKNK